MTDWLRINIRRLAEPIEGQAWCVTMDGKHLLAIDRPEACRIAAGLLLRASTEPT